MPIAIGCCRAMWPCMQSAVGLVSCVRCGLACRSAVDLGGGVLIRMCEALHLQLATAFAAPGCPMIVCETDISVWSGTA
jgi:hypothetical protein